ncbi:MAG: hypothetical protein JRG71_11190 [Deltaproteobacteria bacterium]|nr:hypothetical protein [Deltaproteobacteria bacterium]
MKKTACVSNFSSFSISNPPESENNTEDFSSFSSFSSISISNPPELETVHPAQKESLAASSFDSEHWRQQIVTAISNAINLDEGALDHCKHYRPELHRECIAASRALDDAYRTKIAKEIRQAIRTHDNVCESTRQAAQNPMGANRLSPEEVTRFCTAHMIRQGGQCPHKGQLDGCKIWEAKNHQVTIDQLEILPEQFLDAHQVF